MKKDFIVKISDNNLNPEIAEYLSLQGKYSRIKIFRGEMGPNGK